MCRNCVRSADGKRLTNFPDPSPAPEWDILSPLLLPQADVDFARARKDLRAVVRVLHPDLAWLFAEEQA